jgi:hypothetical protein
VSASKRRRIPYTSMRARVTVHANAMGTDDAQALRDVLKRSKTDRNERVHYRSTTFRWR